MRMLYKYPQREFPYGQLVEENRRRNGTGMEYELLDTGIFDDDRYFDIVIEYAKAAPESIAIRVEIFNRGPEDADLHVLPHLWFRNTWAWTEPRSAEPVIRLDGDRIVADDRTAAAPKNLFMEYRLGERFLYGPPGATPLFSDNESNAERLYGASNRTPYVKDAFHRYLVHGEAGVVNPAMRGTKACLDYKVHVAARSSVVLRLSLTDGAAIEDVDAIVASRKSDADEFYATVHPPRASDEEKMIQRQALAGLLWSKQFYYFDVNRWLEGDNPNLPPPESRKHSRNRHWRHLNSMRLLSMPDKWEYPWFAAWDLAFQCISLALVDPGFARSRYP